MGKIHGGKGEHLAGGKQKKQKEEERLDQKCESMTENHENLPLRSLKMMLVNYLTVTIFKTLNMFPITRRN